METFAIINEAGLVLNITVGMPPLAAGETAVEYWADGSQRKNTAVIGGTYDADRDAFIILKPYPSWVLDENAQWQAPVPKPDDGKAYLWDEPTLCWVQWDYQFPSPVEVVPAT